MPRTEDKVPATLRAIGVLEALVATNRVGGEFVLKRRLGSEISRDSAAAKHIDQAKH